MRNFIRILTASITLIASYSLSAHAAVVIPMQSCQYENGGKYFKPLRTIAKVPAGELVDLSFSSKDAYQYPIVDVQLKSRVSLKSRDVDQVHISEVKGGLNFITLQSPEASAQDHFLVLKINDRDCYYAQIKSFESAPEDEQPQFVKAQMLSVSTSCSIQEGDRDYRAMLIAFLGFTVLLLILYRIRMRAYRIQV